MKEPSLKTVDARTVPGGDLHSKQIVILVVAVVIVLAVAVFYAYEKMHQKASLPAGWGDPNSLTQEQRQSILSSMSQSPAGNYSKLTTADKQKIVSAFSPNNAQTFDISKLSDAQRAQIANSFK